MAKALKVALFAVTKAAPRKCSMLTTLSSTTHSGVSAAKCLLSPTSRTLASSSSSRVHGSISSLFGCSHSIPNQSTLTRHYSTEVDKEIAKFLEKEIEYETSRASNDLPKIPGFEIDTEGGNITLTKKTGSEKVVVKLSVNGAVDSILSEGGPEKQNEPPQMVCRPPFDVEITKGNEVLAFQCNFPVPEEPFEDAERDQDAQRIDDQFEIQEVAIHNGDWKESTFTVSAATMDAELFDLLMDMLDERGINDEFIAHLVDYCTAYENSQYITFLKKLKATAEK